MQPLGKAFKDAEASTGEFQRLPAGGYVARITAVEDADDKLYLRITFDIAEGQFKAFYSDEWSKDHPYAHQFVRSYKETALGMFKGFLKAIDESNGTQFEAQAEKGLREQELVGKVVGIIIGYEEYMSNRGELQQRTRVTGVRSVDVIREGRFNVPELKRLENRPQDAPVSPVEGFHGVRDADLPF